MFLKREGYHNATWLLKERGFIPDSTIAEFGNLGFMIDSLFLICEDERGPLKESARPDLPERFGWGYGLVGGWSSFTTADNTFAHATGVNTPTEQTINPA